MKSSTFAFLGLLVMTSASVGCADESDGEISGGDEEFTQSQIPGVVAIQFESRGETKTVGAKAKVAAVMKAMQKPGGSTPRCAPAPSTKITFFDKNAKPIATGSLFCFLGSVTLDNGRTMRFQTRPGALDVLNEPLVPADALWAVSSIDIERRAGGMGSPLQKASVTDAAAIGKVLAAYDIEQAIDTRYSGTRCPPTHIVTFRRANNEVATSTFICGTGAEALPASVTSLFTIPRPGMGDGDALVRGGITIDPRPIQQAADAAR